MSISISSICGENEIKISRLKPQIGASFLRVIIISTARSLFWIIMNVGV